MANFPEQIAAHVARAVEVERDGKLLPHEFILRKPSLRRLAGSQRTPTALRFFCLPFEDLFTADRRRDVKQKGRIERTSVAPIWRWVSQSLLPHESKIYCRNFKAALASGNHIDARAHGERFWPLAAEAMRAALADGREAARAELGSDLVLADAEEAALLLGIGVAVMKVQELLVKPVAVLSDELLCALRRIHEAVSKTSPEAAPYIAVIATNRLARPLDALTLTRFFPR